MEQLLSKLPSSVWLRTFCCALGLASYFRVILRCHILFQSGFDYGIQFIVLAFAFFTIVLTGAFAFLAYARVRVDASCLEKPARAFIYVLVCSVGYFALRFSAGNEVDENNFLFALCAVVYAVGLALALCSWGAVVFQLEQKAALSAIILALPLYSLFDMFALIPVHGIMSYATPVATVLMPLCWLGAYRPTRVIHPRHELSSLKDLPIPLLVILVVGTFSCSIAIGVLALDDQGRPFATESLFAFVLCAVIGAALLFGMRTGKTGEHTFMLLSTVGVLLVIVMLFVTMGFMLTGASWHLPTMLIGIARSFCLVSCLIVLSKTMHEKALSPTLLFTLFGALCFALPTIVGRFLVPVLDSAASGPFQRYATLVILIVSGVLICTAFLTLTLSRVLAVDDTKEMSAELKLQDAYELVARGYDLTPREKEVMQLIAEGHQMKKIGEMLFISLGTVQSHSKKIYKKLDVHSRQELLDLVQRSMNS